MASTAPEVVANSQAESFLTAFDSFAQAVRRARGTTGQAPEAALTLSQYALLESLADRDAARVRELADEAGIAASTATRILDALERRGIVRRTRTREDRRGVTITLTDRGQQLLSNSARVATRPPARVLREPPGAGARPRSRPAAQARRADRRARGRARGLTAPFTGRPQDRHPLSAEFILCARGSSKSVSLVRRSC